MVKLSNGRVLPIIQQTKTMKKSLQFLIILAAVVMLLPGNSKAQDTHFSQYNASPMLLNPALAGLNAGDYRVYANFRTQWMTVSKGNTYRSFAGGADLTIGKATKYNSFAGIGLSFVSDQAGDVHLNTNSIQLTPAYHFMLNRKGTQQISGGLQVGFNIRTIDPSRAIFDSQYDPATGAINTTTGESFGRTKVMYIDAGIGLLYNGIFKNETQFFIGCGLSHVNQPKISFLPSGVTTEKQSLQRLAMKTTIHGGMSIRLGSRIALMPNFLILVQGASQEFNIGCHLRTTVGNIKMSKTALYFGAQYRGLKDAVIVSGRMDIKGFTLGLSYDINISKLIPASKTIGAPEVSLMYQGAFNKKPRPGYCPAMF